MMKRILNACLAVLIVGSVALGATAQNRNRGSDRPNAVSPETILLEGVVASLDLGLGQGTPSFVLARADGSQVSIIMGPYYFLQENDFEINVGDQMVVRAFPSLRFEDAYVAVELENLTLGTSLALRDENGVPLWIRGGSGGPDGGSWPGRGGAGVNPADIVVFIGNVAGVNLGPGQRYPSFTLTQPDGGEVTIMAGPYHVLLESDFTISVGDEMQVRAFPSLRYENTFVAVELENLTTAAVLRLRDENGAPLWRPGRTGWRQAEGR